MECLLLFSMVTDFFQSLRVGFPKSQLFIAAYFLRLVAYFRNLSFVYNKEAALILFPSSHGTEKKEVT